MKHLLYIFLFCVCSSSIITGCSHEHNPILMSVQKDMDLNPDSISDVLLSIDTTKLNKHDKATFILLLTQSLHKSNRLSTDTINIDYALSYFNKQGEDRDKLMANFYKGVLLRYKNDNEGAVYYTLRAYEIACKINDYYWIAKTSEGIADIYANSYLPENSWEYNKKAIQFYQRAGRIDNHRYAWADYGLSLFNGGYRKNGIAICDSIREVAKKENDNNLWLYASEYLLYEYSENGDDQNAKTIYENLAENPGYSFDSANKSLAARILLRSGETERGEKLLSEAQKEMISLYDSMEYYYSVREFAQFKKDYFLRSTIMDTLLMLQNENVKEALRQPLYKGKSNYFFNKTELEESKSRTRLIILISSVIFFL
ncbi:MAG: hypothetical protein K2L89_03350, partial [Muribaculaceae bacterium]|nr:hypothetical protein [Muribaculaceae bacterium]